MNEKNIRLLEELEYAGNQSNEKKQVKNKEVFDEITIKDKNLYADDDLLENLLMKVDLDIKILTTSSSGFCLGTIVASLIFSLIYKKMLIFEPKESTLVLKLNSNFTMIFIYLIILAIFNALLIVFLVRQKEEMLIKMVYRELRWTFIFTQFSFGSLFLVSIIFNDPNWIWILSVSICMLTTLLLSFFFVDIKRKKNLKICTFFCFFCYLSILLSFMSYVTLFNFSCILISSLPEKKTDSRDYVSIIQIIVNSIQTLLSVVLLTYYKDFFFSLASFYLELSLIVHINTNFKQIAHRCITIFLSVILLNSLVVVYKYGKKAIGFEYIKEIQQMNNYLIRHNDVSHVSSIK